MSYGTPYTVAYANPSTMSNIAYAMIASAQTYLQQLGSVAAGLAPPSITPSFPTGGSAPAISIPTPPSLQDVVWTAPALPAAFTETLSIDHLLPEPFDTAPPTLNFGAAPTAFSETAPDAPGVNLTYDYPTLSVNMPAPPALLTLSTYAFAGVTLPTIDYTLPELTEVAPSVREYVPGAAYTSALLNQLNSALLDRIQNGGTGLNPDVEEAIWNRGREREYRAQADAMLELERMEELGYAMPPGVFLDARLKITTETHNVNVGISRDIMIKQAELEQQNVLKAIDAATQLETVLVKNANEVEQRLFESCKYATEAGIAIYNAKVQAYSAYLDAYKTKVQIYEAQIRGELAKVEVYKAQLSAEETKAQINTALVGQYKVQVEAALTNVEVYKAELAAIQTKAEIEKTKVEVFGEQVKAYAAKINAYTASVEGYKATVSAEASKQDAFKSQVEAYTAQVEATVKTAEALIEEFKGKIAAKNAEWEGYKAAAEAESAKARAIAANNQNLSESYRSEVQGISAYNETLTKQWQVALEQAQRVAEIGVQTAKANSELYLSTRSIAADAAKVGAQVSAQLGAAALNAINFSQSASLSESNAYSISTNYNYSASV